MKFLPNDKQNSYILQLLIPIQQSIMVLIGRFIVTAFLNLKKTINSTVGKQFLPPRYKFHLVQPKLKLGFQGFPYEEWKHTKREFSVVNKFLVLASFIIGFGTVDLIYTLAYNDKHAYYFYTTYPIPMKKFDIFFLKASKIITPIVNFLQPESEYELINLWQKFTSLFYDPQEKIDLHNQKVKQLKFQIQKIDESFKTMQKS